MDYKKKYLKYKNKYLKLKGGMYEDESYEDDWYEDDWYEDDWAEILHLAGELEHELGAMKLELTQNKIWIKDVQFWNTLTPEQKTEVESNHRGLEELYEIMNHNRLRIPNYRAIISNRIAQEKSPLPPSFPVSSIKEKTTEFHEGYDSIRDAPYKYYGQTRYAINTYLTLLDLIISISVKMYQDKMNQLERDRETLLLGEKCTDDYDCLQALGDNSDPNNPYTVALRSTKKGYCPTTTQFWTRHDGPFGMFQQQIPSETPLKVYTLNYHSDGGKSTSKIPSPQFTNDTGIPIYLYWYRPHNNACLTMTGIHSIYGDYINVYNKGKMTFESMTAGIMKETKDAFVDEDHRHGYESEFVEYACDDIHTSYIINPGTTIDIPYMELTTGNQMGEFLNPSYLYSYNIKGEPSIINIPYGINITLSYVLELIKLRHNNQSGEKGIIIFMHVCRGEIDDKDDTGDDTEEDYDPSWNHSDDLNDDLAYDPADTYDPAAFKHHPDCIIESINTIHRNTDENIHKQALHTSKTYEDEAAQRQQKGISDGIKVEDWNYRPSEVFSNAMDVETDDEL